MKVTFKRSFTSIWNAVEHLSKLSWSFKETVSWESKGMILPTNLNELKESLKYNISVANEEYAPLYNETIDGDGVTITYITSSGKNGYTFIVNTTNNHVDVTWITYSRNYTCIFQAISLGGWDIETDDLIRFNSNLFTEEQLTKMGKIIMLANALVDSSTIKCDGVYRELIYLYEKKELDIRISCTESGDKDGEPYLATDIDDNMSLDNVFKFIEYCLTEEVTIIKRRRRNRISK